MEVKPKITPEIIKKMEVILQTQGKSKIKAILKDLKREEPHLWDWLTRTANEDISRLMQKGMSLLPEVVEYFGTLFIQCKLQGLVLSELANDSIWMEKHSLIRTGNEKIEENLSAKYDKWLAGELADIYYTFKAPEDEPESPKAIALANFQRRKKEREEEQKAHETDIRKRATIRQVEKETGAEPFPAGVKEKRITKIIDSVSSKKENDTDQDT